MKIGLLRETKKPVDRRVALIPEQIARIRPVYPQAEFMVQSSEARSYSDEEYKKSGIHVVDDIADCQLLFGVKEIAPDKLIAGKTYLIFSHTAKEQPQNKKLLQRMAKLGCTLIDYEYLVHDNVRVVAFGYWAGIVGAYLALLGYGTYTRSYSLKPPAGCRDLTELKKELKKTILDKTLRFVVTGEGRVASGAAEILQAAGIERVAAEHYLKNENKKPVFCHTGPQHYTKHYQNKVFDFNHFVHHPDEYESNFREYIDITDILIMCHYWDKRSPHFFTRDDMKDPSFSIRLISDISCDIPGPVPSTIRTSTLESPYYGIDRIHCSEIKPFQPDQVTVTAVDNLPSALPRDASEDFGEGLISHVLPELLREEPGKIIENATILNGGKLTERFGYLKDYLGEA